MAKQSFVPFTFVLNALLDMRKPIPPTLLHRFDDLNATDLSGLKKIWLQIYPDRRISLLDDLEMLSDSDPLVNFDELSQFALTDPLPAVRSTAIRLLWECDNPALIDVFLNMMENDIDEIVRASAAAALSQFIYFGEFEEISPIVLKKIETALLRVIQGEDKPIVRRRALESMGYSSREEIPVLLRKYIASGETEWIASAIFAMGRSLKEEWEDNILLFLESPEPEIRLEAVRAAGNLELSKANAPMLDMLNEEELDDEVRLAAVWSLSQIGGEGVRSKLEALYETTEDDEEADLIEQALDNLAFNESLGKLSLLEIEPEDEDDLNSIIELDADADEDNQKKKGRPRHKSKK